MIGYTISARLSGRIGVATHRARAADALSVAIELAKRGGSHINIARDRGDNYTLDQFSALVRSAWA